MKRIYGTCPHVACGNWHQTPFCESSEDARRVRRKLEAKARETRLRNLCDMRARESRLYSSEAGPLVKVQA